MDGLLSEFESENGSILQATVVALGSNHHQLVRDFWERQPLRARGRANFFE